MPTEDSTAPGEALEDWQRQFLNDHRLPSSYIDVAHSYFDAIASVINARKGSTEGPLIVALNGSQGSGKSTLSDYLARCLQARCRRSVALLSLDDFYLTRKARQTLAETVHPLLMTRGVPGTHDVPLLMQTLDTLRDPLMRSVHLPRFDKSSDDRAPQSTWPRVDGPVDLVLLEGWCLGARSEDQAALAIPANALERDEDAQGCWRNYSNQQLALYYEPLYDALDLWVMLAAPSFDCVLRWRTEQEQKLRAKVGGVGDGLLSDEQLVRFVAHFQRWTDNCLRELPPRCDIVLYLDAQRRVVRADGLRSALL